MDSCRCRFIGLQMKVEVEICRCNVQTNTDETFKVTISPHVNRNSSMFVNYEGNKTKLNQDNEPSDMKEVWTLVDDVSQEVQFLTLWLFLHEHFQRSCV